MKRLVVAACCLLVLSACAVPHERSDLSLGKDAARTAEVDQVFERYRTVRNAAIKLLDPRPLSTVESDAVLDIDSGSFEVSQRLAQKQKQDTSAIDVTRVVTPHFSKYPLWFLAVVRDRAKGVNRIQIFERAEAADPWLLVASPETVAEIASARASHDGSKVMHREPRQRQGHGDVWRRRLRRPTRRRWATRSAPEADTVVNDSFIRQMRAAAAGQRRPRGRHVRAEMDCRETFGSCFARPTVAHSRSSRCCATTPTRSSRASL